MIHSFLKWWKWSHCNWKHSPLKIMKFLFYFYPIIFFLQTRPEGTIHLGILNLSNQSFKEKAIPILRSHSFLHYHAILKSEFQHPILLLGSIKDEYGSNQFSISVWNNYWYSLVPIRRHGSINWHVSFIWPCTFPNVWGVTLKWINTQFWSDSKGTFDKNNLAPIGHTFVWCVF